MFKMLEVGNGSGVDLIKQMQLGGNLQDAWMIFDDIKHVSDGTTMACHMYDSMYCRSMTVAICDM